MENPIVHDEVTQSVEQPHAQKILLVSETPIDDNFPNGVLTSAKKTLEHFQDQGYKTKIICPKTDTVFEEYAGFPITTVRSMTVQGFPIGVGGSNKIPKLIKKFKPDVTVLFSPFGPMSEYAINAARARDIPIVENYQTDVVGYFDIHERSMFERYGTVLQPNGLNDYSRMEKLIRTIATASLRFTKLSHHGKQLARKRVTMLHNQATINLVPSLSARNDLIGYGVDVGTMRTWGRGVDVEMYNPQRRESDEVQKLRATFLEGRDIPIVGYVGRIAPEKDLEDLANLAHIDMQLVIVGDGPSLEDVKRKLGKNVIFLGKQHNPALANIYSAFDIFVHPGKKETFGQTIQEAQATGIPAVAPNIGGPMDTIIDGETGFHFSPYDKKDMTRVVERLVVNPELRRKIGTQARQSVERKSWKSLGIELDRHITEARAIHAYNDKGKGVDEVMAKLVVSA